MTYLLDLAENTFDKECNRRLKYDHWIRYASQVSDSFRVALALEQTKKRKQSLLNKIEFQITPRSTDEEVRVIAQKCKLDDLHYSLSKLRKVADSEHDYRVERNLKKSDRVLSKSKMIVYFIGAIVKLLAWIT